MALGKAGTCADPVPSIDKAVAVRKFSIRPTLTLRGRKFKGFRGWSGKPLHPPLTDIPIAAYVLAAAFDVTSAAAGKDHTWARELWHVGTYIFVGGAAVSVLAALTGLWDARGGHPKPAPRRDARSTPTRPSCSP